MLLPDDPRFAEGLAAYRAGRHFEAHERWEALWIAEREPRLRSFLQALIQIAAAMHKLVVQKNPASAARILGRARGRLASAELASFALGPLIAELDRARGEIQRLVEGEREPAGDPIAHLDLDALRSGPGAG